MKPSIIAALLLLANMAATAQEATKQTNAAQPTIMVVPFTKASDDIRKTLDADPNRRIAITKVKEAFDNRGFSTVDFVAKLKEAETRQVFTMDNQTDLKTQIIEFSGADIYVEAEAVLQRSSTGNGVEVILTAYDASTATSLSNKVGFSGKFYTEDYGKLTAKAVESVVEDFLNVMQNKFTEMLENGRFVAVEFNLAADSDLRMSTEIAADGLPLSDLLEVWMGENAFKGSYHIQGTSDLKIVFDQVRIPVKDASGASYTTNKFALEIYKYCRKISKPGEVKVGVKKEVKGNTIFITLT
ncbi:MAG: DUF6175 family protein [Saprospiraceae bacterium]|jgi:hypothetical protein|nr:DUF6175 family protein [Saprospiraceae bacterium]